LPTIANPNRTIHRRTRSRYTLFTLAFKNVLRRKGIATLALLGIGLGSALIITLLALAGALSHNLDRTVSALAGRIVVSPKDALLGGMYFSTGTPLPAGDLAMVRRIPAVREAYGRVTAILRPSDPMVLLPLAGYSRQEVEGTAGNPFKSIVEGHAPTIMEYPMTSCGCFECILSMLSEANGFMIVNREHSGMTPSGMTFSTLAGTIGGGAQMPGFMGIGKAYINSPKFVPADGGLPRVVWMPKALKEQLRPQLEEACAYWGLDKDFLGKIADETVGTTGEEILPFLEEKGHPALTMDSLI